MKFLHTTLASCAVVSIALLGSCGDDDHHDGDESAPACDDDVRGDDYVAGITAQGAAQYSVALMDSNPSPPSKGDNIWSIELSDAQGVAAAGMELKVSAFMPDHGHATTAIAVVTDDGDGAYTISPVNLFMPGYWEISIEVVEPEADSASLDTLMFKFCIEG